MTQEEKDLLLDDLCARLSHGVKIQVNDKIETLDSIDILDKVVGYASFLASDLEEVKPYLFPLSSMTEKQKKHLFAIFEDESDDVVEYKVVDFYNKNHLDYRCLIEKGLAIDATGLNIY